MNATQRAKAFYVSITLYAPKKKGKRPFISGGGKCFTSGPKARKYYEILFKKLHGRNPIPL